MRRGTVSEQSGRGQPHSMTLARYSGVPFSPRGFGVQLSSAAFRAPLTFDVVLNIQNGFLLLLPAPILQRIGNTTHTMAACAVTPVEPSGNVFPDCRNLSQGAPFS